ncbi:hypothetical protein M2310_000651 [Rhizobium leguminosarum]|uniref:Uncharacterized protein n=1 Tax=Rhizobium esperanzae TaxID=1967781 RepID=A0A7W6XTJ0_9HYPH|nr:hypothetical protein [Rhizobium esperanzae]MDH6199998.1 hypothetical protein [Rhizobium leguminosarum]
MKRAPYIEGHGDLGRREQKLSSLGRSLNWRGIDEQISGICSSRSNQSCRHDFGLFDTAEFIWLGIRLSAGRFDEPGLRRWIPTRRRPFVQLLETVVSLPARGNGIGRSVRQALRKPSLFDDSPNGSADRDTERDADRGVIEQHRADCGAYSDSYRHTESHGRDSIQVLRR